MFIGTHFNFIYIIKLKGNMFNSKEELKNWISDYLVKNGKKSLHIAINNSSKIKNSIIEFTNFLPNDVKINQRCFHIITDLIDIPDCKECKLNKVNFNNRNKEWRYLDFCSNSCGTKNKETQIKLKNTNIIRYGVDNISKSEYFLNLMKISNNLKYGVDWYQQSSDFRLKSKETCLKKYGFDSYTKTKEFKDRLKNIFMEKYGVDWYSKSKEFKEKFKISSIEKYGVTHPMLNEDFKKKVSQTIFEKYGNDW